MTVLPGFIGPAYASRSPNAAIERTINLYPELVESHSDAQNREFVLYGTPGYRPYARLPGPGGVRGLYTASRGRVFGVVAERVYELFSGGTWLQRGTLTLPPATQPSSQTGTVSLADDGLHLVVVDGQPGGGWTLKLADNTWQPITGAGFVGARRTDFFDGVFVFDSLTQPGVVYISGLYDPLTEDPLEFATAESSPDGVVAHIVNNREWWILGTRSTEIWFDSGAQEFPFAPIQGTTGSAGCAATHSLRQLGNRVYWLATAYMGQAVVVRSNGYQPERISTHAVELSFRDVDLSGAVAYSEEWDGHGFYVLCLPGGRTWAYDSTSNLWHERALYTPGNGDVSHDVSQDLAQYHTFAFNIHLVGGWQRPWVYWSDPTYFYHDDQPIVRDRVGWHVKDPASLRWLYWATVELDMERGVGLDGGVTPGSQPQAMLRFSDDAGHTWGPWKSAPIGQLGQYTQRVIWRRLGKARDRVPWVRITDPVKVALIGARMEIA